jgi:GT2 family glycosyltransferase
VTASIERTTSSTAEAPRVSVVVAMFERREKTVRCAESLAAQTIDRAEIIFVDDGSEDGTPDAIEAVAARSRLPMRVIRNERNLGANASRNRGVAAATAPLVAFLDSDCEAAPDWLERLVEPFEHDPGIGAGSGLVEDACVDNLWELAFRGTHRLPRPGPCSRITSCNLCIRRSLLPDGAWDESRPTRTDGGRPDTAISARCDEEGLNLAIRVAGWKVIAIPSAKAVHHHPYTRRSLLRQAWFGGASVAEIQWRYRLGFRKDLGPIFAAWGLLLIGVLLGPLVSWWSLLLPLPAAGLATAAISFNELRNKGKTPLELLRASPALVVYYHVRLAGWLRRRIQLRLGIQPIEQVSPETLAAEMPPPGAAS